jgi:hypothetical protein
MTLTVEDRVWSESALDDFGLELDAHRNALDSVFFGIPTRPYIAGKDVLETMVAEGLKLPPVEPVTIGGLPGKQVHFTVPSTGAGPDHGLDFGYLVLYGNPTGDVGIAAGHSARVAIVDFGDQSLVISVDAPNDAEFAVVDELADTLLRTIRFDSEQR